MSRAGSGPAQTHSAQPLRPAQHAGHPARSFYTACAWQSAAVRTMAALVKALAGFSCVGSLRAARQLNRSLLNVSIVPTGIQGVLPSRVWSIRNPEIHSVDWLLRSVFRARAETTKRWWLRDCPSPADGIPAPLPRPFVTAGSGDRVGGAFDRGEHAWPLRGRHDCVLESRSVHLAGTASHGMLRGRGSPQQGEILPAAAPGEETAIMKACSHGFSSTSLTLKVGMVGPIARIPRLASNVGWSSRWHVRTHEVGTKKGWHLPAHA
jgi:hypothetical protein